MMYKLYCSNAVISESKTEKTLACDDQNSKFFRVVTKDKAMPVCEAGVLG